MTGQRARTQAKFAIQMDQNRRVLRRNSPPGRDRAHVIAVTSDKYLGVQSLYFVNIIIGHWLTIIESQNSSSNRTNPPGTADILSALSAQREELPTDTTLIVVLKQQQSALRALADRMSALRKRC